MGSPNSNIPALAAAIQPQHVIVSSRDDRSNQLSRVFGSGAVLHTSTVGCVTIQVSPDGAMDVQGFRDQVSSK